MSIDARVVQARDAGTEREGRQRFERFRQLNEAIDEATRAGDEELAAELRKELGELRAKFRGQRRIEFSRELRTAMRREAEMLFRHLLREDRSVLDLIDAITPSSTKRSPSTTASPAWKAATCAS